MNKNKKICIILDSNKGISLIDLNALEHTSIVTLDKRELDIFLNFLVICEDLKFRTIKSVNIKKRYGNNLFEKLDILLHGNHRLEFIYEEETKVVSLEELKILVIEGIKNNLDYHLKVSLIGNSLVKRRVKKLIIKIEKSERYEEIINILKKL